MSDTIYARPGATFYSELDNAETGLVGDVGVRILRKSDEVEVVARSTAAIVESPAASGRYRATLIAPEAKGEYTVLWDTGTVSPDTTATDDLVVTYGAPSLAGGLLYATAGELRSKLKVDAEVLPDEDADELLESACDLIDSRLGNRPIDTATGRKVVPDNEEDWRIQKLAKATLEVAKALFEDPGLESRQRAQFVSGDVSANGFYGPAFGEKFEALLTSSGLRVNTARAGGGRRRSRWHR